MKALTLTQPWATLIASGAKRVETRSWGTSYRGPVAIHAAKGLGPIGGKSGLRAQCGTPPFDYYILQWRLKTKQIDLPLGAIVAVANLASVKQIDAALRAQIISQTKTPNEIDFGDYTSGRYAWFLDDVVALEKPIPCNGALGLWEVDVALTRSLDTLFLVKREGK